MARLATKKRNKCGNQLLNQSNAQILKAITFETRGSVQWMVHKRDIIRTANKQKKRRHIVYQIHTHTQKIARQQKKKTRKDIKTI